MSYRQIKGPGILVGDSRFPASVANLDPAMTINGTTVYPTFRYKLGDADGTDLKPWGYGEILTLQAGTAPTYNNGSPLLGPSSVDDSVLFNDGGYYESAGNLFGNPGTDDFVMEVIGKWVDIPAGNEYFLGNTNAGVPDYEQLVFAYNSGGKIVARMHAHGGTDVDTSSAVNSIPANTICHAIGFFDRSGYGQWYVNGVASGSPVDISGQAGTIDPDQGPLTLGGGITNCDSTLHHIIMWQGAAWLDTHLQATVAAERFALLTNTRVQKSWAGAAFNLDTARNSVAYSSNIIAGENKIFLCGNHLIRPDRKIGDFGTFDGFLTEGEYTNQALQNNTLDTTWAPINVAIAATPILCPDGITRTTVVIHEDTSNAAHYLYQPLGTTERKGVCIFAKALNRDKISIGIASATKSAQLNLTTGTIEYTTSDTDTTGEFKGDGWWKFYVAAEHTAAQTIVLWLGRMSRAFQGLDQDSIAVCFVQAGIDEDYPSSPITTLASPVTRAADAVSADITGLFGTEISLRGEFWLPDMTPSRQHVVLYLWGDVNNNILIYHDNGQFVAQIVTAGGAQYFTITDSYFANKVVKWRIDVREGRGIMYTKKTGDASYTPSTINTSVATPIGLTTAYIANNAGGSLPLAPGTWRNVMLGDRLLTTAGE